MALFQENLLPKISAKFIPSSEQNYFVHFAMRHPVLAYVQNAYWEDMLNEQKLDTVYICQDWAMKFLPTEFRESQKNWFGKKVTFL